MKTLPFLGIALACLAATPAFALDVDTFDTYADTNALDDVWSGTGGFTNESVQLGTDGGANGTQNYMKILDGGFSVFRSAPNLPAPPNAGTYKLSFYYKNGIDGLQPWRNTLITLSQDNQDKINLTFTPATPPVVSTWTLVESGLILLDNTNPLTVKFSTDNGAEANYALGIDQLVLTEIVGAPPNITASPDDRYLVSRTRTVTALPTLGSGSYSQVTFDVGADNTIEFTDTTAPYEFVWDTLPNMPQGTSGTVALKITVTDTNTLVNSVTENYIVDNEFDGRQVLVSTDFSQFQTADGEGNRLPVGWLEFQKTANSTYGPGPDRNNVADQALKIHFTANDYTNRYTVRSEPDQGAYYDLQASYYGKGPSCRLYYATSTDNATYTVSTGTPAAAVNSANWGFSIGGPLNLGLTTSSYVSVTPHTFNAGDIFIDEVHVEANKPTVAEVSTWNLY